MGLEDVKNNRILLVCGVQVYCVYIYLRERIIDMVLDIKFLWVLSLQFGDCLVQSNDKALLMGSILIIVEN